MRIKEKSVTAVAIGIIALFLFSQCASAADPLPTPLSGTWSISDSFKTLLTPFTNFINDINSANIAGPNVNTTSGPKSFGVSPAVLLNGIDNWGYGLTGIHFLPVVTGVIDAIATGFISIVQYFHL